MRQYIEAILVVIVVALAGCAHMDHRPLSCQEECAYRWVDCLEVDGDRDVCAALQIKCMARCRGVCR